MFILLTHHNYHRLSTFASYMTILFLSRRTIITSIYHVALTAKQRIDLSVIKSNSFQPTCLPHAVKASALLL